MTEPLGTRWYAAHTQPHGEGRALANLAQQGFTAYLPRCRKTRRHARRTESVAVPFFPRYLFVALDLDAQRWRAVNGTFGVAGLVGSKDRPAALPDGLVEALRAREDDGGCIPLAPSAARFAPGDAVRVVGGAFDNLEGLFEGLTDNDRVRVLLDLLGRKVRVFLAPDAVAPA